MFSFFHIITSKIINMKMSFIIIIIIIELLLFIQLIEYFVLLTRHNGGYYDCHGRTAVYAANLKCSVLLTIALALHSFNSK